MVYFVNRLRHYLEQLRGITSSNETITAVVTICRAGRVDSINLQVRSLSSRSTNSIERET